MIRLAIYYSPCPDSQLAKVASSWLGRTNDTITGTRPPTVPGIADSRLAEIVKAPFYYGFHATIKPPFHLKEKTTISMVIDRLERFTGQLEPFSLSPLELRFMDDFFCLRPVKSSPELQALADDTVRHFDDLRKPANEKELRRRRSKGLTRSQERMLVQWGYPYVMDEFRFHLTLTGKITDHREMMIIEEYLHTLFDFTPNQKIPFNSLSLFMEQDGQPFVQVKSFPFS